VFDPRHVARLDQLTAAEWTAFSADLHKAVQAIVSVTQPDHVNVESLGNVVPHLHWHIIPRYVGDARWGLPIWMTPSSAMPDTRLEVNDRQALLDALKARLQSAT
jgi:diadenosine tetraphosphate (Ap4A) HIT family hydrolase